MAGTRWLAFGLLTAVLAVAGVSVTATAAGAVNSSTALVPLPGDVVPMAPAGHQQPHVARSAPSAGSTGSAPSTSAPNGTGPAASTPTPALATPAGPAAATQSMAFDVVFPVSHPKALAQLANAVSLPGSPEYRHFLSVRSFARRFGPPAAAIATTDRYLASHKLRVGALAADALFQPVSGTVADVTAALHTTVADVTGADGVTAPSVTGVPELPANVAADIGSLQGIQPWTMPQPSISASPYQAPSPSAVAAGGSQSYPDATAVCPAWTASQTDAAWTPGTQAAMDQLSAFWSSGYAGQGQTVGLVEYSTYSPSDISTYASCIGLSSPPSITNVVVQPVSPGSPEADFDIETLLAATPDAKQIVYTGDPVALGLGTAISQDKAQVLSDSWSVCTADVPASTQQSDNTLYAEAVTQGQSILAASGDSGAEGCAPNGNTTTISPNWPAASPYVVGVGGTTTSSYATDPTAEAALWPYSGGGLDQAGTQPPWQNAPGTATYETSAWCDNATGCRQVPDVSADAAGPYPLYCTIGSCATSGSTSTSAGWGAAAGTSAAAPSWASALALENQRCGASVGFVLPTLYEEADAGKLPLGTVLGGSNDVYGANGGQFQNPGTGVYSPTSGLGDLGQGGPSLAAGQLCTSYVANLKAPADQLPSTPVALVASGTSTSATVSVASTGQAPLDVTGITVASTSVAGDYSVGAGTCTGNVTPGSTCTFTVTYTGPSTSTPPTAVVSLADDAFDSLQYVTIVAPAITAPPSSTGTTSTGTSTGTGTTSTGTTSTGTGTSTGTTSTGTSGTGTTSTGTSGTSTGTSGTSTGTTSTGTSGTGTGTTGTGGTSTTSTSGTGTSAPPSSPTHIETKTPTTPPATGYNLVGSDGGVFVFSTDRGAGFYGSLPGLGITVNDIVGLVPTADGQGYFLVGRDGGVFAFGNAPYLGSLPGIGVHVNDIVGLVPTPNDQGYFLVGRDGGVFAFGNAPYLGSLPGLGVHVNDVAGIAATASGHGYWLVTSHGAVTGFGDATNYGSVPTPLDNVSAITATPSGAGYWIVTQSGALYSFGGAVFHGSLPSLGVTPSAPVIGMVATTGGYLLVGADGGIYSFGDAPFAGSLPGLGVHVDDIVGVAPTS